MGGMTSILCRVFPVAQKLRICLQCRRPRVDRCVRKILWRREWQSTPVFLPGESLGQRSPAGYTPWDRKESDTTERLAVPLFASDPCGVRWVAGWERNSQSTVHIQGIIWLCYSHPAKAAAVGKTASSSPAKYPMTGTTMMLSNRPGRRETVSWKLFKQKERKHS